MAGTAGSVAPVFRDGGYDDTVIYDFYHALIHNNKLYFCRQDGTIGHEPQEKSDEYWFLSLDGNFGDAKKLGGETAAQWQTKIDVEKARIDALIALEESGELTDIEKEVNDIKVGADGVTYGSAGTAVRTQIANVNTKMDTEIGELKSDLSDITYTETKTVDVDTTWNTGFMTMTGQVVNGGIYDQYQYSEKINVKENDIIHGYTNGESLGVRMVTAFNNGVVVESLGSDDTIEYIVPKGVDQIVITKSFYTDVKKITTKKYAKASHENYDMQGGELKRVSTYSEPILLNKYPVSTRAITVSASMDLRGSGDIVIDLVDVGGVVRNSFTVNSTTVKCWNYNFGTPDETSENHGLSYNDNIQITVTTYNNHDCKIMVTCGGETHTFNTTIHKTGVVYPRLTMINNHVNVTFSWCIADINKPIWCFGDSYFHHSTSRWMFYLVRDGYDKNTLIDSYGGEYSAMSIISLRNLIKLGKPKYIFWCLGMNDGSDSETEPSSTWKTVLDEVIAICEENNITLVLGVVPTVPSINHEKKAEWIRNSGYQYVDFYKAVGANSSGQWYDGMLSSDNVHPDVNGGKALYGKVLTDFPQIISNY